MEAIFGSKPLKPEEAFKMLREFHNKVGFTGTMKDIGFTKADVGKLVEATLDCPGMKGLIALSPVVCEDADIAKIYTQGFFE